jgi:uncharacterized protein
MAISRPVEWPDQSVVTEARAAPGWRPLPFQEFVLKIHSRCNLACRYCYVYEMADQSWRSQPRSMSARVLEQSAHRIAEHAHSHRLERIDVVLHGGEPLLAGPEFVSGAARTLRRAAAGVDVRLSVQTNGLLLDDDMLAVLAEHEVLIGVSLDGGRAANDRHRRYRNGNGSFDAVAANLARLANGPHRQLFTGLLCTIDLANDPVRTYEDLLEFSPPGIDFLLPHGNWTQPPPAPARAGSASPYGDWLVTAFDRWYSAPRYETGVRTFQEIMNLLFGGASRIECIGLSPVRTLVIETAGSLEQVDTLKSTFDGAAATGYDVFTHPLDAVLTHPAVVARQRGMAVLSPTCQACPVGRICGGGYYPHRYRAGSGFRNPSVFCLDLQRLISHIHARLSADLDQLREPRQ